MKTLDEVITVMDHVEFCCTNCKLQFDCDETECILEDALHYLKAFRDAKNALDAERERTIEAYCQFKEARENLEAQTCQMRWVDKHFQFEISDNPALPWSELRQMEGKPVWVEADDGKYKKWFIVGNFFSWFEKEDFDAHVNLYHCGSAMEMSKENYGSYWKAYWKERG